jgi:hypothetical protein
MDVPTGGCCAHDAVLRAWRCHRGPRANRRRRHATDRPVSARVGGGAAGRRAGRMLGPGRLDRRDGDDRVAGRRRPGAGVGPLHARQRHAEPARPQDRPRRPASLPRRHAGAARTRAAGLPADREPPAAGDARRGDSPAARHAGAGALCPLRARARPDRLPRPKADGIFRLAGTNARREIYGAGATKQPPSSRASAALEACGFNGALRGRVFLDVG